METIAVIATECVGEMGGYAVAMALFGELIHTVALQPTQAISGDDVSEVIAELDIENRLDIISAMLLATAARMGYPLDALHDRTTILKIECQMGLRSDPIYVSFHAIGETIRSLTEYLYQLEHVCAWSISKRIRKLFLDPGRKDRIIRNLRTHLKILDAQFHQLMELMKYLHLLDTMVDHRLQD